MNWRRVFLLFFAVLIIALSAKILLSSKTPSADDIKQIVDFKESQITQVTVEKEPARVKRLVPVADSLIHDLGTCLKKDLCGEKPDPNRSYFDPENTESHRKLNRALRFSLSMQEKVNPSELPKKEDLLPLLSIANDETPVLALEILVNENMASCEEILSEVVRGSGKSLPLVFSILFQGQCERAKIVDALTTVSATIDADTLQALSKNFSTYQLNESEFRKVSPNFCRLKTSPSNWSEMKGTLTAFLESGGFSFDLKSACGPTD